MRGLGLRSDGLLEFLDRRKGEAVLNLAGDRAEPCIVLQSEGSIIGVERFEDDDFVVRIADYRDSHADGFAAAVGNQNVSGIDVHPESLVILGEFFPVGRYAGGVRILDEFEADVFYCIDSLFRRFDVRLSYIQMIYFDTPFFCFIGERHEFPYRRSRHHFGFF